MAVVIFVAGDGKPPERCLLMPEARGPAYPRHGPQGAVKAYYAKHRHAGCYSGPHEEGVEEIPNEL